jgi:hypothetical protein
MAEHPVIGLRWRRSPVDDLVHVIHNQQDDGIRRRESLPSGSLDLQVNEPASATPAVMRRQLTLV